MKEKYYMDYQGSFEENFSKYIGKPGFFGLCEEFCGRINDNKFWFYKRSAIRKNSFRTILYGEVLHGKVSFSYKKHAWLTPAVLLFDIIYSAFLISFAAVPLVTRGYSLIKPEAVAIFIALPALISVRTFIYPKKEREALCEHLKQICGQEVNS